MSVERPLAALAALQLLLGARVLARLARGAGGRRIETCDAPPAAGERVAVVVPVLDEIDRLAPCLDGLLAQGAEVHEILVVDGGSGDGTPDLVRRYAARDARVSLLDAAPVPPDWNGKAWGLHIGAHRAAPESTWLLLIDADVRPAPLLARSLLAHAHGTALSALSVGTRQEVGTLGEALAHPAMLTTLVYRFGPPGHTTRTPGRVQANGQCFLLRRDALARSGAIRAARASRCEDVTIARCLARHGYAVGFYEAGDLAWVRMYTGWREVWCNWPRSLPMRDRYSGAEALAGWLEVTLIQALPLPLTLLLARRSGRARAHRRLLALNLALVIARLSVLCGTARAYRRRPWTYWLSPLCDLPVAIAIWHSALRRRHTWRGRALVPGAAR